MAVRLDLAPDLVIWHGDVRESLRQMPDNTVQCVVTSPPYYGLRDYGTAQWEGGDPNCDHVGPPMRTRANINANCGTGTDRKNSEAREFYREVCGKCGARRVDRQIGLEPTVEEYVAVMVEVFREVRRVLRKDGTLWLNLGDSYNGSGGAGGDYAEGGLKEGQPRYPGRKLNGLKPKDLIGVPWRVAFALQADGWYLRSDIIWCLSGGTWVYAKTPKGEMPMTIKDLVRLDPRTVQLWNGQRWTQVLGWSPTPRPENAIEIVLRSGERIGCTPGHIWPTRRGNVRADELRVGDVLLTCQLPEPEEPVGDGLDDEDTGWLVGMYLAEGSRSGDTVQIASHVKEVSRFERLERIARSLHGSARFHRTSAHGATINLHGRIILGVIEHYAGGRTAKDKHLKPTVWQRSNRFLRAVLQGYLEGDGHYDAENDRWRLGFARNYALEQSLRTLCARLGVSLRLKPTFATYQGGCVPVFRGEIRFNRSDHHNTRPDSEIVEIRRSRARQFWDIGVADEPHLFALASGVLTHNSKPNPMPESVTDRPTKSHEYVFLLTKSPHYYYDADAIREPIQEDSLKRYQAGYKGAFKRAREADPRDGRSTGADYGADAFVTSTGRNKRSVWTIPTQPFPEAHFATFPEELPRLCILAGTSPMACPHCGAPWRRVVERYRTLDGERVVDLPAMRSTDKSRPSSAQGVAHHRTGSVSETTGWQPTCSCEGNDGSGRCVVLDPFWGSGTTGKVALQFGRIAWGVELNPDYIEISKRRLTKTQTTLLGML